MIHCAVWRWSRGQRNHVMCSYKESLASGSLSNNTHLIYLLHNLPRLCIASKKIMTTLVDRGPLTLTDFSTLEWFETDVEGLVIATYSNSWAGGRLISHSALNLYSRYMTKRQMINTSIFIFTIAIWVSLHFSRYAWFLMSSDHYSILYRNHLYQIELHGLTVNKITPIQLIVWC